MENFQLISFNESIFCQPQNDIENSNLIKVYGIISLVLGPINAILNGICVHIFKHHAWKQSSTSRILKGLSVIELCMGVSLFAHALLSRDSSVTSIQPPQQTDSSLNITLHQTSVYQITVKTITLFIVSLFANLCLLAFQVARNWSVVLLAAYRYDRICRPIGTETAFPRERIPVILAVVAVLSCLIVVPRAFEYGILVCRVNGLYSSTTTLLIENHVYHIAYIGVAMFIVQSGGPVICVCVLSAFVIRLIARRRKIHQINEQKSARHILSQQQRNSNWESALNSGGLTQRFSLIKRNTNGYSAPSERPQPSGDKLIFAVCVTFFIFETPAFFSKILHQYIARNYQTVDMWLSVIANVLIYVDSTMNAFVYMASNPTFRKIASEELLRYRKRISQGPSAPNAATEIVLTT